MFRNIALILFATILVFGCGGGDDKSSSTPPVPVTPDPTPMEPAPVPETPRAAMSRLLDASDTITQGETINADIWSTTTQPTPATLTLSDMTRRNFPLQHRTERQGVSLASVHSRGVTGGAFDFGGWMEHSFFLVAVWNPMRDDPLDPFESVYADVFSAGNATGTNPVSGSATWRGAMIGVDASEADSEGNAIVGDATISIGSFANPAVDVSFTGLVDQTTNTGRNNMSWRNLPVRNGAFDYNGDLSVGVAFGDRGDAFNSLTGRFYGPNHEEVGGVFIRDQIVGSFGARR